MGFTEATSNPASPLKAPAQMNSSMHDSVDSFSMFMSGGNSNEASSSQPTESVSRPAKSKKNSQSLDDQMHSVFKAPSYQNHSQNGNQNEAGKPSERMNEAVSKMQLSEGGKARAQKEFERKMKEREEKEREEEREMNERLHWKDTHDEKLRRWEFDNEVRRNIRVLIQHLPDVLPKELKWAPIPLSKLLNDGQVKKGYYKAVRVLHPDKSQQRGDSIETQVICDFVFQALEMAYKTKFL